MRLNRKEIIDGLNEIGDSAPTIYGIPGMEWARNIREAIAYIRQLEADLRRQGFTEYNTKEEDNDQ